MPRRIHFPKTNRGPIHRSRHPRIPKLISAVLNQDEEKVHLAVTEEKYINQLYLEKTALDYAIEKNNLPIATVLLKQGGKIRTTNRVALKKFLMKQNQQDENVQICVDTLLQQPELKNSMDLIAYKNKLSVLNKKANEEIINHLLQQSPLPAAVIDMVCQYSRYTFFNIQDPEVISKQSNNNDKTEDTIKNEKKGLGKLLVNR